MGGSMTGSQAFTVYYDGSCPLCVAEIGFYRGRRGADAIEWVDVSATDGAVASDLGCAAAMARFHVRDKKGMLIDGGPAFAALWKQLPSWRWLGIAFSAPPLRWIIGIAYELFLPVRPYLQRFVRRRADTSV